MLNPALIAQTIRQVADGYTSEVHEPLPFRLAYLAIPLVLQTPTKSALPATVRTQLPNWIATHAFLVKTFRDTLPDWEPVVTEGLIFGLAAGIFQMRGASLEAIGRARRPKADMAEVASILKEGQFAGRWFGRVGSPATVFSLFGVRA